VLKIFFYVRRLCLVALLGAVSAHGAQVVVVSNERAAGHQEVAQTLVQELIRGGVPATEVVTVSLEDAKGAKTLELHQPRVVVSLGTEALREVLRSGIKTPLVASLIPRGSFERALKDVGHGLGGVSALYLDQPFGRQLDVLRIALPEVRRIGVLWGAESASQQSLLASAARTRGLELSEEMVNEDLTLPEALRAMLESANAVLAVPDSQVFNGVTLSNILLASYRARVPLMAFSPAYVKAGALLSVHSLPIHIANQSAQMARQILGGKGQPPNQYPTDYAISVNQRVARSLGIVLDEATLLERLKRAELRP
jgi:putative ABC transport system substrate-binding protein